MQSKAKTKTYNNIVKNKSIAVIY